MHTWDSTCRINVANWGKVYLMQAIAPRNIEVNGFME